LTTAPTKNNYIDNKKLYEAMAVWIGDCQRAKAAGDPRPIIPNYIAECIVAVNNKLILKREFCRYQFAEEMIADGILNCLEYLHNFDPVRFKSAFNYLTTIAYFAFVRRIQREKRYLYTKLKISQNMLIYHEAVSRQDNDNGSGNSITELTIYANEFISKYEELSNKRATKK